MLESNREFEGEFEGKFGERARVLKRLVGSGGVKFDEVCTGTIAQLHVEE